MRKTVNGQVVIVDGWSTEEQKELENFMCVYSLIDVFKHITTDTDSVLHEKYIEYWSSNDTQDVIDLYQGKVKFMKDKLMYVNFLSNTEDVHEEAESESYLNLSFEYNFLSVGDNRLVLDVSEPRITGSFTSMFPETWLRKNHPEYVPFMYNVPANKLPDKKGEAFIRRWFKEDIK